MHVHVYYHSFMRTTIEIPDAIRAKLLEIAARRRQKGFSGIVQEALEAYFEEEEARREKVDKALAALGTLEPDEADRLEDEVRRLRATWR